MHGIDERQWLLYLDGERCAEIEKHLPECADCSDTVEQLRRWRTALLQEGSRLQAATASGDARMERMLEACLADPAGGRFWTRQQATLLLCSLLEPFCGAGAARAITEVTVRRCAASSWRGFVGSLSDTVESICGSAAGRLVGHAGLGIPVENR